jgi:hypothetical protein
MGREREREREREGERDTINCKSHDHYLNGTRRKLRTRLQVCKFFEHAVNVRITNDPDLGKYDILRFARVNGSDAVKLKTTKKKKERRKGRG